MKWEWTREEEFIGATTRHQMTTKVKIGAKKDGTLTALDVHVVSNTGAYGNHASETLAAAMASPIAAYRCENKKGVGHAVYTNMIAGRRLPRLRRLADDLRHRMRDRRAGAPARHRSRSRCAARTWCGPATTIESIWKEPSDASFGSYGIDQCLDIVEQRADEGQRRRRSPTATTGPKAPAWRWPCWNAARRPSIARAPR